MTRKKSPMEKALRMSVTTHLEDPLYPRIVRAVEHLLAQGNVVAPVDVLVRMGLLPQDRLDDWRHGRVPYLERVIHVSLPRLSRVLRLLRTHTHALALKPSWTAYMRAGQGPRQRLRFTKTGDANLEAAYATHFVRPRAEAWPPADRPECLD